MKYDLTFLVKEEKTATVVSEILKTSKGKILKENVWGEKTLSYPIKNQPRAYFFNYSFEMDKSALADFKKKLNFEEKILRFLLLGQEE